MKKILYTIALAAAVFTGCKKEVKTDGVGTLQMNLDRSTAGYVTKATNDNPKEFVIEIKRTSDGWTRTYPRFANMPQQLASRWMRGYSGVSDIFSLTRSRRPFSDLYETPLRMRVSPFLRYE